MWVLPVIGYIGLLGGFGFLTLAIASGLYYLSELVEEHTVPAKKFLTRLIYAIVAFQVLLTLIDGLPWISSTISVVSHAIYLQNLRYFPIVRLTDPIFIVSCLLVLLNHYLWFVHFSSPPSPNPATSYYYSSSTQHLNLPSFTEIASFFFLQVWLVPFALFVSLSASENVLPSMGSEYATDPNSPLNSPGLTSGNSTGAMGLNFLSSRGGAQDGGSAGGAGLGGDDGRGRKKSGAKGMVRVAVDGAREWVRETGELMGFWRGERTRRW